MVVNFLHQDRNCSAYVICGSAFENLITAYILDFNSELGYEIVFRKGKMNTWQTNENIKTKHPLTYYSLCSKLSALFPSDTFIENNEMYSQEFAA